MGKYEKLGEFLRAQPRDEIPLTFSEIERLTGVKLPRSHRTQSWWNNSPSNNVMTQVWLDAGYRTEKVDVVGRKLVFRRKRQSHGMEEDPAMFKGPDYDFPPPDPPVTKHPASGALKGLISIEPGYDLTKPAFDDDEIEEWEANLDRMADEYDAHLKEKYGPKGK